MELNTTSGLCSIESTAADAAGCCAVYRGLNATAKRMHRYAAPPLLYAWLRTMCVQWSQLPLTRQGVVLKYRGLKATAKRMRRYAAPPL